MNRTFRTTIVLVLAVVCTAFLSERGAAVGAAAVAPPRFSQLWCFIAGASADTPEGRFAEPTGLKSPSGVSKSLADQIIRFHGQGWRNFYLDSPFGKDRDENGQPRFTFFGAIRPEVLAEGSPWADFVPQLKRATGLPNIRVMAYLGNPYTDTDFKKACETGDVKTCLEMIRKAVTPLKEAGVTGIGVDASNYTDENHWMGEILKFLELVGFEVFIEGPPSRDCAWLSRFSVIETTWWARNSPKFDPQNRNFLRMSECKGTKIQVFDGTAFMPKFDNQPMGAWVGLWVQKCIGAGKAPAFGPYGVSTNQIGIGSVGP